MPQRNWLITGVSSGFGRIMTEQLLARGASRCHERASSIPEFISTDNAAEMRFSFESFSSIPFWAHAFQRRTSFMPL
jgi:NAD(P)-dependent dehydrogenase (short-subunit alcohol dehydrogenase family)